MKSKSKTATNTIKHKVKSVPKKEDPVTTVCLPYKTLATFLQAIRGCADEVVLHIDDAGLSVKTVDMGNVYMLIGECPCKTEFESKSPAKIGIDTRLLTKALLHAKGCNIKMTITDSEISLGYGRFTAKVGCADYTSLRKEPNGPPEIHLNNEFSLPGKYLDEICRMVSQSGKIRIHIENKVIMLTAEDGDLSVTEVVGASDKNGGEVNSSFSVDYLKNIAKIVKNTECTVRAGIDYPVHIFAEIDDCKFQLLLAPRTERAP